MIPQASLLSGLARIAAGASAATAPARVAFTTTRGHCKSYGATVLPGGVNFALFARHAQQVNLVLFKEGQDEPLAEISLDPQLNRTGDIWHIFVHGVTTQHQYGYRVQGLNLPKAGHRYNPRTILLDPYARAISGGEVWGVHDSGQVMLNGDGTPHASRRCRIVSDDFDWGNDVPPQTPLAVTIIYEMHVRGFTRHPSSAVHHPGTYQGVIEKIRYLQDLGVTAVQLMPVLEFDELEIGRRHPTTGEPLQNFWGYAPLSFFAPKAGYAAQAGQQLREFKEMVKTLHRAGIEVILDVVYNHTGEGNEHGPTFSFRGLDNLIYYLLDRDGRYHNFSGCGNTVNCNQPVVRELILDSLAYLVSELHVDGFRFDLAATLGRGSHGKVLDEPTLLQHIAEHPVLSSVKLIAEAWDMGTTLLGKFPAWGRWSELNGWFRDDVRRFVRSEPGATAAVAKRICGSLDLYGETPRQALPSINFITCHDGFTLHDLVSYDKKHNWANGEHNRDGWDDNLSYNCGHEGPTDNPTINAMRQRQMRNFLTLLLVSQGVPLLLQGDEFGRTQHGNNNAYCQDNETSWLDWALAEKNAGLLRFTQLMIQLRKKHFAVSRDQFVTRVTWHGAKVGDPDWTGQKRMLAFQLHGTVGSPDFHVMFNAHWEWQRFQVPPVAGSRGWHRLVDTNLLSPEDIVEDKDAIPLRPADHYVLAPRSTVILIAPR
jgi:glycogen operon protein